MGAFPIGDSRKSINFVLPDITHFDVKCVFKARVFLTRRNNNITKATMMQIFKAGKVNDFENEEFC